MPSVLICSVPIHGHVAPLLAVSRHLVEAGVRVRLLTGGRYREAVEGTGAEFVPLPTEADFDDSDLDAAFPGRAGLTGPASMRFDITQVFMRPMPHQLRAVREAVDREPVDAVLAEALFAGAAALTVLPRSERPPVIALGISPMSLRHPDVAPFGLGVHPLPGPVGRVRNAVLALVAEKIVFAPVQREAERLVREATGLPLRRFVMDWPAGAEGLAQFTVPGFEYPRPGLPDSVRFVGPVARTAPSTTEPPAWWPELDGSRPVVHVTQGTLANRSYDLIEPAIAGLAGTDALVVVSTGGRDVSTLPHPLPSNVRAAEYLPYDRLLPLTDVMVSNGGYGGVHYAMEHGVPLVVAGRSEEKTEVNARVGWSGAGIDLRTSRPAPHRVAAAVEKVLADDSYRRAARRIGAEIAASPGPLGVLDLIHGAGRAESTDPADG